MHCPKCGHQQASMEIKYCSKCGFQMGLIPELLVNDGVLPQLQQSTAKNGFWTKKNGVIISILWWFLCWFILTPLCGVIRFNDAAGFFAIAGFLGIPFGLVASLLLLPRTIRELPAAQTNRPQTGELPNPAYVPGALPPQQSIPAQDYIQPGHWKAPDTGQFAQPGSVTDNTTKLLEKDI